MAAEPVPHLGHRRKDAQDSAAQEARRPARRTSPRGGRPETRTTLALRASAEPGGPPSEPPPSHRAPLPCWALILRARPALCLTIW